MSGNAASWFVDRHAKEGREDKVAFREAFEGGRALTYGELVSASGRMVSALARAGVVREQRAAMFVLDQVEFPVIFWGALKSGVVPVAVNTLLSTDVYKAILSDCRATIAFVSAELAQTVLPAAMASPHVREVVVIGEGAPEGTTGWQAFMRGAKTGDAVECSGDEIAFWLYSSGSTGEPKGVRHVHEALRVTADNFGEQVLGVQRDDIVFSAAKLFFAYGLGNAMTFPMAAGATSILLKGRPTPEAITAILETEKPTVFFGVPTLYAALLQTWEGAGAYPGHEVRMSVSAGEALPAEIGRRWKEKLGVDIIDGVGSTEMLHIFLSNAPGDVEYGTSGVAVPGYEMRLVDEEGRDVGTGRVGELLVRGGSAAADYWNKREKSRSTFEGEWTRTGDKYERQENGRFVYCGRTDDMFKVSGIWVSPFEVEQALAEFPSVLEAAVVAKRDGEGLEKPKAFVVLKDGQSADSLDEIKEFIKDRIGKWKYPRWVEVVDELPKTATGKIQRFKLRERS